MANRNHALDDKIIEAAKEEFLSCGYQKASLHKIAEMAGITTGALYTRYQNKDDLFCSLVETAMMKIESYFVPLKRQFAEALQEKNVQKMLDAIKEEERLYLDVLYHYYDECLLFFCCSDGSSISDMIREGLHKKATETVDFLKGISGKDVNLEGIELIVHEQFHHYREILKKRLSREDAIACMGMVRVFLEAGWKAIVKEVISPN